MKTKINWIVGCSILLFIMGCKQYKQAEPAIEKPNWIQLAIFILKHRREELPLMFRKQPPGRLSWKRHQAVLKRKEIFKKG